MNICTKEHIVNYVNKTKKQIKAEIEDNYYKIKLAILQVGDNHASNQYIKGKLLDCQEVGIEVEYIRLPDNVSFTEFYQKIYSIVSNKKYDGIIIQKPLPENINNLFDSVLSIIPDEMDVDGFRHSTNFKPCTPKGIIDYLSRHDIDFSGKHCVVVGRSDLVGKPIAKILLDKDATVTMCHSKTIRLDHFTQQADILIVAAGVPKLIDKRFVKPDAIVIDVGINVDKETGKLCGDVDYSSVNGRCKCCTPVPNGVGLLTRLALLENLLIAHRENVERN